MEDTVGRRAHRSAGPCTAVPTPSSSPATCPSSSASLPERNSFHTRLPSPRRAPCPSPPLAPPAHEPALYLRHFSRIRGVLSSFIPTISDLNSLPSPPQPPECPLKLSSTSCSLSSASLLSLFRLPSFSFPSQISTPHALHLAVPCRLPLHPGTPPSSTPLPVSLRLLCSSSFQLLVTLRPDGFLFPSLSPILLSSRLH